MQLQALCYGPLSSTQGVVIGTGEQSQFGEVFKMMQAEEVRAARLWVATVSVRLVLSQSQACLPTHSWGTWDLGVRFLLLILKLSRCAGEIAQQVKGTAKPDDSWERGNQLPKLSSELPCVPLPKKPNK